MRSRTIPNTQDAGIGQNALTGRSAGSKGQQLRQCKDGIIRNGEVAFTGEASSNAVWRPPQDCFDILVISHLRPLPCTRER